MKTLIMIKTLILGVLPVIGISMIVALCTTWSVGDRSFGLDQAMIPKRKPSSVTECNKGDLRACRELKEVVLYNIRTSKQYDKDTQMIVEKIVSGWNVSPAARDGGQNK